MRLFLAFYINKVWEIKQILMHSLDPDLMVICTGTRELVLCSVYEQCNQHGRQPGP